MGPTLVIATIAAWALALFVSYSFFKAGKFKLTATREAMLGAGFGWIEKLPTGAVRLIAILELAGAAGIILAPAADQVLGLTWAGIFGILAAAGLALTMLVAGIMHIVRGEFKYTYKANVSLFAFSAVLAGLLIFIG